MRNNSSPYNETYLNKGDFQVDTHFTDNEVNFEVSQKDLDELCPKNTLKKKFLYLWVYKKSVSLQDMSQNLG